MGLEVWFYMNGLSKLAAPISSKQFLGFNYVFSVQVWYICLNLIDLSKKSTFCLFKTEFKAKKLFARLGGAANLERPFIYDQTSTIHNRAKTFF